jgi:hypothetical protein
MDLERERRLPFKPALSPKAKAERAYNNLLEACDGDQAAAFEAVCAYAERQREGRRALTYDTRFPSRGQQILSTMHRSMARDQDHPGGEFNIADLTEEQLRGIVEELAGEQGGTDRIRVAHDRRMKRLGQDNPNYFEGRPNPGGTIEPMAGSLTYEPAGSRAAGYDHLPPSLRKEAEALAVFKNPGAMRSYDERFPDAARLGRV